MLLVNDLFFWLSHTHFCSRGEMLSSDLGAGIGPQALQSIRPHPSCPGVTPAAAARGWRGRRGFCAAGARGGPATSMGATNPPPRPPRPPAQGQLVSGQTPFCPFFSSPLQDPAARPGKAPVPEGCPAGFGMVESTGAAGGQTWAHTERRANLCSFPNGAKTHRRLERLFA